MTKSTNTFGTLKPVYKEAYAKESKPKKEKGQFNKLRNKLLKDWKPKKTGL